MRNPIKTSIVILGVAMGCALAACAQTQPPARETTGNYVDDASITTKVKAAILNDASLKVFDIHVVTNHSVVQLTGTVRSHQLVNHANDVVSQVAGVVGVQNDLVVQ
jgi:osmotically-inducible protein OsmY